ncbi:PREDICTED: putative clathrin assembly protein At2g25430 [Nicotiana attenuata]|uniref:Clathrin coat assembly protein ap180 n=1 Tax=Nicotiana attenuata TaxID=49451 RepID=A0A314KPF1_NICAT|nr:PREDICTED: putative clathrin assembly protein At2g25430 [Nicotiana attenuata]OIT31132.1 clathrin coat assembly protein ap180 [Nicotiana attenuata]
MHRRIKQVFTSLREHTCVSYAKIATIGGLCDLDHIVVKATSPDDIPLPDRYVLEILQIFSICPSSFGSFAVSFSRRFGKTRCWRVALKCLLLLHRLLRSLPDISPFREELLLARSNSLVSLYPCNFKDCSSSASQDYTNFIRSYARLLDESLDCFATPEKEIQEDNKSSENFIDKMDEVRLMLEFLPQLQNLIDRVLECRPTGPAARSFLVQSAMKHIIRDSFTCYTTFRKEIVEVLDYLIQLPYKSCAAAFEIYKKAAIQANELSEFYDWCKSLGLRGMYEYPFVDKIPKIQIRALENFLSGMWQLTDGLSSSSTSVSPVTSTPQSPSSEDGSDKQKSERKSSFEGQSLTRKEESEMQPLIQFEDDNDWETLLDASVCFQCTASRGNFCLQNNVYQSPEASKDLQTNGWELQVHNPYALNQFHQPKVAPLQSGTYLTNPVYPWGI